MKVLKQWCLMLVGSAVAYFVVSCTLAFGGTVTALSELLIGIFILVVAGFVFVISE